VTGHSLGYNIELGGGNLNLNVMKPKEGKPMIGAQYVRSFDKGGKVGKLAKGVANVGKRLMAERDVLPAAEREENLQKFLGNSRIRERLYHATPKDFTAFKPGGDDPTISGPAIWLTPNATKQPAAHNISSRSQEFREGTNVMPVYAQARSPLMLDDKLAIEWAREVYADGSREFPDLLSPKTIEELKKGGYDSIIHADPYGNRGGEQEIIMFEPNKIKSAIGNRGTYDIEDPDITKAQGGLLHMAGGGKAGKVAKGLANIGNRLMADAPQAEAMKLAQERAALPPANGGLGLPKNNTPQQRAAAMGFDRDTYHGSFRDIKKLDPSVGSTESHAGKGIYSTDLAEDASQNYASIYGPDPFGRVERGLEARDKDYRKIHGRMRDGALTPRQQEIILQNTIGADNLGVVYPLKVRSDKSIHLDAPESNPVRIGPFEHYDEAADVYVDTPHTAKFNEALDEFRELGGDANPVYEAVQDYGDAIPARDVFNAVKKTGNESGLYDPFTGDIVSGGVAAGDFVKHFGIDEIRHTPQFRNRELNIANEHIISMNPDNVRSRFAAFDPFRKSAATAAAMGVAAPDLLAKEAKEKEKKKAEGGSVFKTIQWQEPQHFDGGGMAVDLSEGSPLFTKKEWETIKHNAPAVYEWAKQNVKDEANQLKSVKGAKDFGLRVGAQYVGAIPDLVNLGLMIPDALFQTKLSSEKPWFGSEQIIDAMHNAGVLGENEFPIAETLAGIAAPAGLIKKGAKKGYQAFENWTPKSTKKRRGGLTAMSR
jgi:hypothetical protein